MACYELKGTNSAFESKMNRQATAGGARDVTLMEG
jgi:hypothetical protein